MLRHTRFALLAAAVSLPSATLATATLATVARAQDATTTRIETRAFYGATVTLEAGVRVFRPLPPHSKVIINPGGVTPLHLGHEEYRATTHNYNYNSGDTGGPMGSTYDQAPYYSPGFVAGRRPFKRHRSAHAEHAGRRHAPVPVRAHANTHGGAMGGGRR